MDQQETVKFKGVPPESHSLTPLGNGDHVVSVDFPPSSPAQLQSPKDQRSEKSLTLFEIVAAKRNFEQKEKELREILQNGWKTQEELQVELKSVDGNGKTILHHAAKIQNRIGARIMTETILEHYDRTWETDIKLVDMQDHDGNTALHMALLQGREKLAQVILSAKPDLAVRNYSQSLIETNGETCLELIQKGMPKLLKYQFDHGVQWADEDQEQILLNFNKITESHYDFDAETSDELDKHRESNNFSGVLKGRSENFDVILDHPLVQVFLLLKYRRAYPFIIISMFIHVAWHVLYAYFIFQIYYSSCPWKPETGNKFENISTLVGVGDITIECNRNNIDAIVLTLGVVCWVLGFLFLCKEAFEVHAAPSKLRYFTELENIGQLFVCSSVVFTSIPVYQYLHGETLVAIQPWQYKVSAVTIFIVWTLVLGQICKIRQLRIYIEIFLKVITSFGLFICTFASLLFAFAFSLCILMPEGKAFTSPWLAVPKVLVMMTGELNYDEVFHSEAASAISPDHYLTTQVLFSLFTILMSMVLLNMLIGLAVNDTTELRLQSHIAALYSMLQEIFLLESFAFRLHKEFKMPWLFKRLSINLDTQHRLDDPFTRCLFRRKGSSYSADATSVTDSRLSLASNPKIKIDPGLLYKYSTVLTTQYPFGVELMSKLLIIADEKCSKE